MVSVHLNGRPYQCATCKEELTTDQYQRILKEWGIDQPDLMKRDWLKLFNILSNSHFTSVNMSLEVEQAIWECVAWVLAWDLRFPAELPKVFEIGDRILSVPKKVGACSFGQNVILKQVIDRSKYIEENIAMATAVYLTPEYFGTVTKDVTILYPTKVTRPVELSEFSAEKARELEQEILKMPAHIVYPVGFFLLSRANQSGMPSTRPSSPTQRSLKQSLKRMLPRLLRWRNSQSMPI